MAYVLKQPDQLAKWSNNLSKVDEKYMSFLETTFADAIRKDVISTATYPSLVAYPIQWTSERQRKYVMGFVLEKFKGKVYPYIRKGTYYNSIRVEVNVSERNLIVYNDNPIAPYLTGAQQQRFHKNTGWQKDTDKFAGLLVKRQDLLRDGWTQTIRLAVAP